MNTAPLVSLVGVNGDQFVFSSIEGNESIVLLPGATGMDLPPWDVQVDELPAVEGAFPRDSRAKAREIFLPLMAYGQSRAESRAAIRRLRKAVEPSRFTRKTMKLRTAEVGVDGRYEPLREIGVYYAQGLEGDEGSDNGLNWTKFGLVLRSFDPFFQDLNDTVVNFLTFENTVPFFPQPPDKFLSDGVSGGFKLSSAPEFSNSATIINPGEVRVYPTWEIVGPIEAPFSLTRAATDYNDEQSLNFETLSLAAGETLTVVTQPGKLQVQSSAGADAGWSALAINPDFWTVDPGTNSVTIQNLSVTPTQVTMSFRAKYLGM